MPGADTIFAVLGPVFLVLGAWRCVTERRLVAQGKTWLIVGVVFTAVALWLHGTHSAG